MRQSVVAVLLCGAALMLPTGAFAGDKAQSTFTAPAVVTGTAPPPILGINTNIFVPGVSKGKTKGDDKCKLQIQLSGITFPDTDQVSNSGDEVVCIGNSNVSVAGIPTKTGVVLRGEVKGGTVKISVDLAAEGIPCTPSKKGGPATQQYNGTMTCYIPVPLPAAAFCLSGPALPFLTRPLEGVCLTDYAGDLGIPFIATQGISFLP